MREIHAEHGFARLEQREVDGHVRLRARVGLHVDVFGAEERLRPRNRERLRDVNELAAAVPLSRIAFCVSFVITEPAASSTAALTKFSDAISSSPSACRLVSRRMASAMSGSVSARTPSEKPRRWT